MFVHNQSESIRIVIQELQGLKSYMLHGRNLTPYGKSMTRILLPMALRALQTLIKETDGEYNDGRL